MRLYDAWTRRACVVHVVAETFLRRIECGSTIELSLYACKGRRAQDGRLLTSAKRSSSRGRRLFEAGRELHFGRGVDVLGFPNVNSELLSLRPRNSIVV